MKSGTHPVRWVVGSERSGNVARFYLDRFCTHQLSVDTAYQLGFDRHAGLPIPDRTFLHCIVMSSPIPSKLQTLSSLPRLTSLHRCRCYCPWLSEESRRLLLLHLMQLRRQST